jgi:acyl-CoA dehydrogenase
MAEADSLLHDAVERAVRPVVTPALLTAADGGAMPAPLWALCVDLGVDRLTLPAAEGGAQATLAEAGAVIRSLGALQVPVPAVEALVGRLLIAATGLPQPDGIVTLVPTPVVPDATGRWAVADVPWGHAADWLLAELPGGTLALFAARHLAWSPGRNLAGEPRDTAVVEAGAATARASLAPGTLRLLGALARATQIGGAAAACLDLALAYTADRQQFGRPLLRFQVIQHQLAQLAEAVAAIDAVTAAAWQALDTCGLPAAGRRRRADASLYAIAARIAAADRVEAITGTSHQVHGAMGFTAEYPLHHATRRLWAWRAEFGTAAEWAAALGARALARGGERLWHDITAVTDA